MHVEAFSCKGFMVFCKYKNKIKYVQVFIKKVIIY